MFTSRYINAGAGRLILIFCSLFMVLFFPGCYPSQTLYTEKEIKDFNKKYSVVKVLGVETKSGEMIPFHEASAGSITNKGITGKPKVLIEYYTEDSLAIDPYTNQVLMVILNDRRYCIIEHGETGFVCSNYDNILIPYSDIESILVKPYELAGRGRSNFPFTVFNCGYYLVGSSLLLLLLLDIMFYAW